MKTARPAGRRRGGLAFAAALTVLAGCASAPAPDGDIGSSITVVAASSEPKLVVDTPADGAAAGALLSIEGGLQTRHPIGLALGIALAPIAALVGAIGDAATALPADQARTIVTLSARAAAGGTVQQRLAGQLVQAGAAAGYRLTIGPTPDAAAGAAVLQATVTEIGFVGGGADAAVAPFVAARAQLLRAGGATVASGMFRAVGERSPADAWGARDPGAVFEAFDPLLRQLAGEIVEQQLLAYPLRRFGLQGLLAGPGLVSPGRHPLSPLPAVDIDTRTPQLAWEPFAPPSTGDDQTAALARASAIRYDVCIWRRRGATQGPCIYRRDALVGTSHRVEEPLAAGEDYAWSVRVRFRLDGRERVSAWSAPARAFDLPAHVEAVTAVPAR